jgi:uncharacterized phage protein (TIGR01671 family)
MREIKFRAWDIENKKMYSPEELWNKFVLIPDRGLFQELKTGEIFDSELGNEYINHMIPLQYTGLKDKNGKEIYEGDIIKSTSELMSNFGQFPTGVIRTELYSIEYNIENARWCERRIKDEWLSLIGIYQKVIIEYSEVIGNIYENPELLNVKAEGKL